MSERMISRRVTEYAVNEFDEHNDIVDVRFWDSLSDARKDHADSVSDGLRCEIEKHKKRYETRKDIVDDMVKKYGPSGRDHVDCDWRLIDTEYEVVVPA